jgi:hypothetical protein
MRYENARHNSRPVALPRSSLFSAVYGWPALRRGLIAEREATGRGLDEKQLAGVFTAGAWSVQGGRFVVGRATTESSTQTKRHKTAQK